MSNDILKAASRLEALRQAVRRKDGSDHVKVLFSSK
jgi:hypothetical protein